MRLRRSLRKRRTPDPDAFWESFFAAYTAGDDALRAQLLAGMRRERLRNAVHALAYSR